MNLSLKQTIGILITIVLCASLASAQNSRARRRVPAKPKTPPSTASTPPPAPVASPKELAEAAAVSRAKLMEASQNYRESLERLLGLQKQDETRAAELVAKRKNLLDLGVIARREVEESETTLKEAQAKVAETQQRMNEVEQLVAEVTAAEQLANQPVEQEPVGVMRSKVMLVRYTGRSNWVLTNDYLKVDAFFRSQFHRSLPVSAFGQTETHNRLGFDHTNALDVAVHPDSAEGQALQGYLRAEGISFIAIRGAITGSATGAHIHIGLPSKRLAF